MRTAFLLLVASVFLPLSAADTKPPGAEGTAHPLPDDGRPWIDVRTGFALPQKLGSFRMKSWHEWTDQAYGSSVRFVNNEAQARADVYVYPCALPRTTKDEMLASLKRETEKALGEVYLAQKQGIYSDVTHGDATSDSIGIMPDGSIPMLCVSLGMTIHAQTQAGDETNKITSWIAITILKDRFVKIRYTFPTNKGKDGEKTLNEFVEAWTRCVREPGLREFIKPHLSAYLANPLSREGRDSAGAIAVYVEKSPFVSLTIGGPIADAMAAAGKAIEGADADILRAFLGGAADSTLRNEPPGLVAEAGAAQVARVYHLLQKQNHGFKVKALDDLDSSLKQKSVASWLRAERQK